MQAVDVSATNKSHVSTVRFDDSDCYSLCCVVIHASKSSAVSSSHTVMSHLLTANNIPPIDWAGGLCNTEPLLPCCYFDAANQHVYAYCPACFSVLMRNNDALLWQAANSSCRLIKAAWQ